MSARTLPGASRDEAGFSLAELMVAVTLMVTVVALFGDQLIASLRFTSSTTNQSQAVDEVRLAMQRVDHDVRSAEVVNAPAPWQTGATLEILTHRPSGAAWVRYEVSGGRLLRTDGGTNPVAPSWGQAVPIGKYLVSGSTAFRHCPAGADEERATVVVDLQAQVSTNESPRHLRSEITARNSSVPTTLVATTPVPCG